MVDLGPIDRPVGQNRTTTTLPEEDTIIDFQKTAMTFQNASQRDMLPPEENNKTTLKYTTDMDNPTGEIPVMQQIHDMAQQPKLEQFQKNNIVQRNKREREGGTAQGPRTRQHSKLEAEQRATESTDSATHQSRDSNPSVS